MLGSSQGVHLLGHQAPKIDNPKKTGSSLGLTCHRGFTVVKQKASIKIPI